MVLGLLDELQIFWQLCLIELVWIMEFQVRHLALFCLFSVIGKVSWFWMQNLHKSFQLILQFLRTLFLVLHFSYYTLMTFFLMMILISDDDTMLMILISTLNLIMHLICGKTWWLRGDLLISMLENLNWFRLTSLKTWVLLMWEWLGLFLRENHLLRCWG